MPSRKTCCLTAALLLLAGSLFAVQSPTVQKPVTKSELMALVAGNALPENIIREVQTRGLAFHPDDAYKAQLKTAGADGTVISAVEKAKKGPANQQSESQTENDLVAHLANAGKFMHAKRYQDAAKELTSALQEGADAEAGFVMGEVLRNQEQFDMAARVYQKVLAGAPEFPEAHTKLAYSLYRTEDYDGAMREAKLALSRTPDNAEAHKNLALPLAGLRKFDAAIAEYREALRIKPDYAAAHFDLGLAFDNKHDSAAAIVEYKKSNVLDPDNAVCHYDLAILLENKGDTEGAIREYREAKRLAPDRVDVRHNLALALANIDLDASIREFRELIAMAPDFELGHVGLGLSLDRSGDSVGAESEYRKAMALDPTDFQPHNNLGSLLLKHRKYDAAMVEFQRAEQLNNNYPQPHFGAGKVYLHLKNFTEAARELRLAVTLDASRWQFHVALAEALAGTGDLSGALAEMKQAQALDPRNAEIMSRLAPMLEKAGDLNGALEQYRLAAETGRTDKERSQYAAARKRLQGKADSGQSSQAGNEGTESRPGSAGGDLEEQWRENMDASRQALNERRYVAAEKLAETAAEEAEKLRPRDARLVRSLSGLAWVYTSEKKYSEARASWMRALSVSQELLGPESTETAHALEGVAGCAYILKDFAAAASFYARAIEVYEKTFGQADHRVISDLYWLAFSYQYQGAFDKAEPIFLKLLQRNSAAGQDGLMMQGDLLIVGKLYLAWGKLDKAETYCRKSLASREKAYGSDSPMLAESLHTLSEVLTRQGKGQEAEQVSKRYAAIMASSRTVAKP